jgi:DNA-binding transcriptional regulator GbsR (MarR family)
MNEKINTLIDDIGNFIEYWGFRKIHGRIWAIIYIANKPLSTPEIVDRLSVSKGLVSIAISELLKHNLIERVGQVKFGGITYMTTLSPGEVVREIIKTRELALFNKIEVNLNDLSSLDKDECNELGVDKQSLKNLKVLTGCHKKIVQAICKKKIITMEDWMAFIKKVSRFAF